MDNLILLPHFGIAILAWFQFLLTLNRFEGIFNLSRAQLFALFMFLSTALIRWISSLSLVNDASFAFQSFTATIASLLTSSAYVITVNNDCILPSRQQALSLVLAACITFLWEMIARMQLILTSCDEQKS